MPRIFFPRREAVILAQRAELSIAKKEMTDAWQESKSGTCQCFEYFVLDGYAALLAAFGAATSAASSHLTETSLETPGSCMVTP
jgi:hypothetical protein